MFRQRAVRCSSNSGAVDATALYVAGVAMRRMLCFWRRTQPSAATGRRPVANRHVPDGDNARMNIVPDTAQISHAMSEATAPAFVLGAVAAFISVLLGRVTMLLERIRSLNEIADSDTDRAHLKSDIPRLRQRIKLLSSSTHLALVSGMCTALLLVLGFVTVLLGLRHEYGAGIIFSVAVGLLGASLHRFAQEVRMGLSEADHYR
jgi:hypothetical protein